MSGNIAKAAIGGDPEVATSFVSAFAPLVHKQRVVVADVSAVSETTRLALGRDLLKNDISLRYRVGGAAAVLEVVPSHYNPALAEIQELSEQHMSGRALAHAFGHYLATVEGEIMKVKAEKKKANKEAAAAAEEEEGDAGGHQARRKSVASPPAAYTAYLRAEPVHQLMLNDFCYAFDTGANVWRRESSWSSVLAGGKYGSASPLFSTFRFTADTGSIRVRAGLDDQAPGPSGLVSSFMDRLSITTVHLPMVPSALDDDAAWSKEVTLPEHRAALENVELRQWLLYLAHTSLKGGKVEMPAALRAHSIFRKSAEMAEKEAAREAAGGGGARRGSQARSVKKPLPLL